MALWYLSVKVLYDPYSVLSNLVKYAHIFFQDGRRWLCLYLLMSWLFICIFLLLNIIVVFFFAFVGKISLTNGRFGYLWWPQLLGFLLLLVNILHICQCKGFCSIICLANILVWLILSILARGHTLFVLFIGLSGTMNKFFQVRALHNSMYLLCRTILVYGIYVYIPANW